MNKLLVVLLFGLHGAGCLAQGTVPQSPALAPGLYVQVLDGLIHVTNPAGTANFSAGQFGFTSSFKQPPVVLPTNPGMQFTPPPSFTSISSASGPGTAKSSAVMCIVR